MIYAVAMSGGVDSSTTAAILQKEGHDVFGITMDIHDRCGHAIENASRICKTLGIQHFVLDAKVEFKSKVMDIFASYYSKGLTPNPCAFCNRDIKMNLLLNYAKEKGAELMATGHYVNMEINGDEIIMKEALNPKKDQSYFLSLVSRDHLKCVRFPLGNVVDKSETRRLAASFGLHNFEQKDSQDICFIPGNYKDFLKEFYSNIELFVSGDIVLKGSSKALAKHNGIANYTIGQRRGLGVAFNEPLYVVKLNPERNEVVVGNSDDLLRRKFSLFSPNWILEMPDKFEAFVKLRSLSGKSRAQISKKGSSEILVELIEFPLTPVTPGQVCAIYNAESAVIGAGIIS